MKRGEVYWNLYRDAMGRDRKVPVLIVSNDFWNGTSMYVTGVRLVAYDTKPCPQHVKIPAAAFTETEILADCYALCETVNSVKQTSLAGPIGVLASNYYMNAVCDGIKVQCGMEQNAWQQPEPVHHPGHVLMGQGEFHTYSQPQNWMGAALTGENKG